MEVPHLSKLREDARGPDCRRLTVFVYSQKLRLSALTIKISSKSVFSASRIEKANQRDGKA
jgi:hypothetical protein